MSCLNIYISISIYNNISIYINIYSRSNIITISNSRKNFFKILIVVKPCPQDKGENQPHYPFKFFLDSCRL